jgi:lysophospholipase L1-like esterase
MDYLFYMKIAVLALIILIASTYSYYKFDFKREKETFTAAKNSTIVLLGDSILKNNSYVKHGKAVEDLLKDKQPNVYSYAKNSSSIVDIYEQLNQIPTDLNLDSTIVFLSVGGNDILATYVDKELSVENKDALRPMFMAYKKLVKSIQTKMNLSRLVLINIYYPMCIKYSQYRPILEEWNKLVDDYGREKNIKVVHIENVLVETTDFTLSIEPSESGGVKIVDSMSAYIY